MEVTVHEAKTHLSRLLRRVEAGESIVIKRGGEPIAVLTAVSSKPGRRHIRGRLSGRLGPDFDDALDDFADHS